VSLCTNMANRSFTYLGNEAECATKRIDEMGGKPQCLYRQALSPWGVAPGGGNPDVKELPLKGTGEARAPRGAETEWRNGGNSRTPITHTE
jgi:hypothetical protein